MRSLTFLAVLLSTFRCSAFTTVCAISRYNIQRRLSAAASPDDIFALNDARVDVRNLLTQRAIQSFMFLCESVRDPHSVKWIEDFLSTRNQLNYHGLAAGYMERFGGTWDAPLLAMLQTPKDVVIVSAKRRGRGHGGWSKDNPYLEDRFVEFEIDIDPVSLVARILSVREQIAAEWVNDLEIVETANEQILDSYFATAKQEREGGNARRVAFERTAVNLLNNHTAFTVGASSPFRKGNFDLLYNLCTQASVHRLLRELDDENISNTWLLDFYTDSVEDFFDGDQPYGRADDFVEDLLLASPSVLTTKDGARRLADPMGIAEKIIEIRKDVVAEWKELMKHVPQDHAAGIRKELLSKQMEAWGSSPADVGGFE